MSKAVKNQNRMWYKANTFYKTNKYKLRLQSLGDLQNSINKARFISAYTQVSTVSRIPEKEFLESGEENPVTS